jgi:Heterokaryon incompatibility protein (HET)
MILLSSMLKRRATDPTGSSSMHIRSEVGCFPCHIANQVSSSILIGDPATFLIPLAVELPQNTASEESFLWPQKQLDYCRSNHDCETCISQAAESSSSELNFPTRLIDLSPFHDSSEDVRLVERASLVSKLEYVTLTYCWGGRPGDDYETTENNQQRRIAFSSLPKNFCHAIEVARRLNIRCLWIDALCMIQDSPVDWQTESAPMHLIYSQSCAQHIHRSQP